MNTKNKLTATFLFSLGLFGIVGYYIYTQDINSKLNQMDNKVTYTYYTPFINSNSNSTVDIQKYRFSRDEIRKKSRQNTHSSSANNKKSWNTSQEPSFETPMITDRIWKGSSNTSSLRPTNYSAPNISGGNAEQIHSSNVSGGLMAFVQNSPSRTNVGKDDEQSASTGSIHSSPLLVPFSNGNVSNPPTTSGGIILTDPMPDTDNDPTIPIGDGWWILLMLSAFYVTRRKLKAE